MPDLPGFKPLAAALALFLSCAAGAQTADAPPAPPKEQNSQNLQPPQNSQEQPGSLDPSGAAPNPQALPDPPGPAKPRRQRFSGATELVLLAAGVRATS